MLRAKILFSASKVRKSKNVVSAKESGGGSSLARRYQGRMTPVKWTINACSNQQVALITCLGRNNFQLRNCLAEKTAYDTCNEANMIRRDFTGTTNFHLKRYGKIML